MNAVATTHRVEIFGPRERWLADERRVAHAPGGMAERTVDVTHLAAWVDAQVGAGARWAFALLVVRAAAIALARRPDLQTIVAGYRRLQAGSVDVGLATSEIPRDAPLLIANADGRSLKAIAAEMARAAEPSVALARTSLGSWTSLIPFGFLRRAMLRWLARSLRFQRSRWGTVHITCASSADLVAPLRFHSGSALGAGRIREAFMVVDGCMAPRRVVSLTVVADHVAMDGVRAAALLNEVADILEGNELAVELT